MQEPSKETMIKVVKEHFNFTIDENAYGNYDIAAYTESTADGYELHIVTHDMSNPMLNEDVYMYDHDVADALVEEIIGQGGNDTIVYADDYYLEDIYFDDRLVELFHDNIDDILAEAEEENYSFSVDELAWLKDAYAEDEETEETVS